MGKRTLLAAAVLAGCILASGPAARAVTIVAGPSQDLDSGAAAWNNLAGADDTITYHPGGVYDWADKDGANTAASADLFLGGFKVYANSAASNSFTLKLNSGGISGTGTTRALENTNAGGSITVLDVGDIAIGSVQLGNGANAAGNLVIGDPASAATRAGNVRIGGINTGSMYVSGSAAGSVTLYGKDAVRIQTFDGAGTPDADINVAGYAGGNNVSVSHLGDFSARYIYTKGGTISLDGDYTAATPASRGTLTALSIGGDGRYTNVASSATNVTITHYLGVSVAGHPALPYGAIAAVSRTPDGAPGVNQIVITHIGSGGVAVGDLNSSHLSTGAHGSAGHVYIDDVAGDVSVGNVSAYTVRKGNGGNLVVSNVTGNVTVGGAVNSVAQTSGNGGNVLIDTSIAGDITLLGELDLNGTSADGYASLATTGGVITLGDVLNPGAVNLDFSQVQYVLFDSPNPSVIYQALVGFSGNGSTQLRVAGSGDVVYYDTTANPGLAGATFSIGGGGELKPLVPEPATVAFLAVGGLGLIGAAVRRRRRA